MKNHNNTHHKATKTSGHTGEPQAQREDQGDGTLFGLEGEQKFEGLNGLKSPNSGNVTIISKNGESKAHGAGSRKRRWSAPERGEIGRSQENDHPETLSKLPFLSQEVKVSIEGRSNMGT